MTGVVNLSRRRFLKAGALAGGGLVLGVRLLGAPPSPALRARDRRPTARTFEPNAFVRVGTDETVTVIVNHSEMGQGPYTSVAMIVAEELDADWSRVRAEAAPVAPVYNHSVYGVQMTGGSTSTWSEWDRLRKAGAVARAMLVAAAAAEWGVEAATCSTEEGHVVHGASGRRLSYGRLADAAGRLKPPADAPLKDPSKYRLIGHPVRRLDTPDKTDGRAVFAIDVAIPGMRVAVVARPPTFGGKVKSFRAEKAKAVAGVRDVVEIPRGVAVVADGFWPAKLGREALEIEWVDGPSPELDSAAQRAQFAGLGRAPAAVARNEGDAAAAFEAAPVKIEADYDLPYLAHATMEPMNCVADVRKDACDVWVGTQFQTGDRDAAAQESGLKPEQVTLRTTFLGGGFGRRAAPDAHFVREAVGLSKAVGAPVKVVWTREDDMRGGFYRPAARHAVRAALDASGAPVAWSQRVVCPSFIIGTPFESLIVKDGVDRTAVEGAVDLPYAIPNVRVEWARAPSGAVPTLWWRSVGHSHTAFAVESAIDELAHAAKKDPYEFRRSLLGKAPRHARLLEIVADKAGWGGPLEAGRGRGIAIHESFGSLIAHVAEASVAKDGRPRVHKFTCAIDCGSVVNPDTVRAQMEGAIIFGLSAALYGEITFEKGRVKQRNFHDYPLVRMHEAPSIDVHVAPSGAKMGGVGEPGVPPVAPALANALFAATGRRVRSLPIRPADLKGG